MTDVAELELDGSLASPGALLNAAIVLNLRIRLAEELSLQHRKICVDQNPRFVVRPRATRTFKPHAKNLQDREDSVVRDRQPADYPNLHTSG
ncbi:hypothetical protein [Sinomonas cyclohexanicum]|uniref:hypothetical protein n=1 Tax=Sinomonas cyclohexanicum TaxID=322009 RepID=UPI001E4F8A2D|nr:hypothetical protein [Corynebacterium cyclohexanicum]